MLSICTPSSSISSESSFASSSIIVQLVSPLSPLPHFPNSLSKSALPPTSCFPHLSISLPSRPSPRVSSTLSFHLKKPLTLSLSHSAHTLSHFLPLSSPLIFASTRSPPPRAVTTAPFLPELRPELCRKPSSTSSPPKPNIDLRLLSPPQRAAVTSDLHHRPSPTSSSTSVHSPLIQPPPSTASSVALSASAALSPAVSPPTAEPKMCPSAAHLPRIAAQPQVHRLTTPAAAALATAVDEPESVSFTVENYSSEPNSCVFFGQL